MGHTLRDPTYGLTFSWRSLGSMTTMLDRRHVRAELRVADGGRERVSTFILVRCMHMNGNSVPSAGQDTWVDLRVDVLAHSICNTLLRQYYGGTKLFCDYGVLKEIYVFLCNCQP